MNTKNGKGHLVVESVWKSYNHNTQQEIAALKEVSLELLPGDFCVIVGANGSGKSTLMQIIAGRIPKPDKGLIYLDNTYFAGIPEYRRTKKLSYVTQNPLEGTAPSMTVAENLALAQLRCSNKVGLRFSLNRNSKERFKEVLSQIGLADRLDQPVSTLSGGERQMLTIFMNSFGPPSLMLLDEPVSALDPSYSNKCLQLIDSLNKDKRITILMITHNIRQALEYGNKLIVLKDGQIAATYNVKEKNSLSLENIFELVQ
jgi:putative tryptophan/tyrosine transport system ATP-binding protein